MRSAGSLIAQGLVVQMGWRRVLIHDHLTMHTGLTKMLQFWANQCGTRSIIDPLNPEDALWDWDLYDEGYTFWFARPEDAVLCKLFWGQY